MEQLNEFSDSVRFVNGLMILMNIYRYDISSNYTIMSEITKEYFKSSRFQKHMNTSYHLMVSSSVNKSVFINCNI